MDIQSVARNRHAMNMWCKSLFPSSLPEYEKPKSP